MTNPVLSRNSSTKPRALRSSQIGAVWRDCQTMALYTGSPVFLSQTTVVSRWLVIPIAEISLAVMLACARASRMTSTILWKISLASCSTQPGFGKYWVNSFWLTLTICDSLSKIIARLLVVPASKAMTYCLSCIITLLLSSITLVFSFATCIEDFL